MEPARLICVSVASSGFAVSGEPGSRREKETPNRRKRASQARTSARLLFCRAGTGVSFVGVLFHFSKTTGGCPSQSLSEGAGEYARRSS